MASLAVLLLIACAALASHGAAAVRVELTRAHADPGAPASRFVRDALRRDMHRHNARRQLAAAAAASSNGSSSSSTVSSPLQIAPSGGEYLMTLAIGTPPLPYQAIADTGSDLIWTQCAPCGGAQCFPQPTPLYDPSSSATFAVLPCDSPLSPCAAALAGTTPPPGCACTFNQTYGSGWTLVTQGTETFTFGSSSSSSSSSPAADGQVPGIAFGCSNASSGFNASSPASGLVGLGRGSLSLVSQLAVPRFSYCLTPYQNTTSTLLLGPSAPLANDTATGVSSTPFVANPSGEPMSTYYYLNLTGISLGGTTALPIPASALSLAADGTGGFIIDSGTTITSLGNTAYQQVRAAVASLVTTALPTADGSAATGLDLCFQLPSSASAPPAMPSMTLHFDGADMVLPAESYMLLDSSGLWCLAMQNQSDGEVSILGNYQQQNMHILYDLGQETLSFAPANCSAL